MNSGVPSDYVAAATFNKTHGLKNNKTSVWNKIVVPAGTSAGNFSDDFTVTFSQTFIKFKLSLAKIKGLLISRRPFIFIPPRALYFN